ncbi:MAG: hypothetical protein JXB39_12550 [Deltaproteobacteria bacterium]|nr:hypothetical protein [Deltaproteobacteria bacterium]
MRVLPLAVSVLLLVSPAARAKDLRKRVAVGVESSVGAPLLSVRAGLPMPSPVVNVLVEGLAGFSTGTDAVPSGGTVGVRLLYGIVAEDNMNLYGSAGMGWTSRTEGGALWIQPALSVECFPFGLENLGLSIAWGVQVDLGSPSGVATWGAGPGLGARYWF